MQVDISFLKSVLAIYDEMLCNGITLVYLGEFNHQIIKMFTRMSESEMVRKSEEESTKKLVYHAMVETLQNINKHSSEIADEDIGSGFVIIGRKQDIYYIITSNKVTKEKSVKLKTAIDHVNSCTKEELKEMYKAQLKDGKLSNKGGAGLGLIDLARKTSEKIHYEFLPIDDKDLFFIFKVEIYAKNLRDSLNIN